MNEDHKVQFGHSDSERLLLSNFKWDGNTYSADADVCAGGFRGAARIYGHTWELDNLHKSLLQMSGSLSGEARFENLEGQLKIHCSIGARGAVHIKIVLTDYRNRVECDLETDPTNLDTAISALADAL